MSNIKKEEKGLAFNILPEWLKVEYQGNLKTYRVIVPINEIKEVTNPVFAQLIKDLEGMKMTRTKEETSSDWSYGFRNGFNQALDLAIQKIKGEK